MGYAPGERTAHEPPERPEDELSATQATQVVSGAWMTAGVGNRAFTVDTIATRLVGGAVVVDITFARGSTVTLRIATLKAGLLVTKLCAVLGWTVNGR